MVWAKQNIAEIEIAKIKVIYIMYDPKYNDLLSNFLGFGFAK